MIKTKYIIYFIVLIFTFPGFSDSEDNLSSKKKDLINEVLNHLKDREQTENDDDDGKRRIAKRTKIAGKFYYSNQEKWQTIFDDPKYNAYVKSLFKNKKFSSWIEENMEPLFFAIQFKNEEMIKFFSRRKGVIYQFKKMYGYPALFLAIIGGNIKIIEFFLNHPETELSDRDSSNNNLFHHIFLGLRHKDKGHKKSEIMALLFNKKYFLKASHLLNEVNNWGATPFDYFLRDFIRGTEINRIMEQFLDREAVPVQLDYIFVKEELNKEEQIMKENIYESKKLTDNNEMVKRIISNIKTYNCERAFEQKPAKALAL